MSKAESSSTNQQTKDETIPGLGVLEEDDEFEEFPVQDWDDSQTDLANLAGAGAAGSAAGGDKLWEDNWDDDDVEEEFSTQLRGELEKTKLSPDAMQH